MKSPLFASSKQELEQLLEADRTSDIALETRLTRCEAMLVAALNLIGAMQPVCTAACDFMNNTSINLAELGATVANYQDYIAVTRNYNEKIVHRTHNGRPTGEGEESRPAPPQTAPARR